jgi:general secretion pathway protein H
VGSLKRPQDRVPGRRPALARGFTLIEILVVVAILAIAAGTIALVLDRDERGTVAREARRLAGALEYAAARAQMRGETIGVSAEAPGWRFWVRGADGRWVPLAGDDALAPRALPSPLVASAVAFAGRAIDGNAILPLRASGRNDPFAFALATPQWRAVLASDAVNRVTIVGPEAVGR